MKSQDEKQSGSHKWVRFLRAAAIWFLIVAASLMIGSYVVVRWTERQVFNTDNWVAMVSPLPKNPAVSSALGTHIGQSVFEAADIESRVKSALPEKAAFLAAPLTSQLQSLTIRAAQNTVASDGFQSLWEAANRVAMSRLLAVARDETPPLQAKVNERFNIDISGVSDKLAERLGTASQAIPALQPGGTKPVGISTDLKAEPRRIHQVVQYTDNLAAILPWAILATILGAVAISRRRRSTLLKISVGVLIVVLIELITIKWNRGFVLDQVRNPDNLNAVGVIFDTIAKGLQSSLVTTFWLMVAIIVFLMLAGPTKWARSVQQFLRINKLNQTSAMQWWRTGRQWLGNWLLYFWLGISIAVLGAVALADEVTGRLVVNSIFVMLSLWFAVYIFANPPKNLAKEASKSKAAKSK